MLQYQHKYYIHDLSVWVFDGQISLLIYTRVCILTHKRALLFSKIQRHAHYVKSD